MRYNTFGGPINQDQLNIVLRTVRNIRSVFVTLFFFLGINSLRSQIPKEGLIIWLSADEGLELKKDSVVAWKDRSGNHYDAILKTPFAPILKKDEVNDFPSVCFNGKNNGFETAPIPTFPNKKGSFFVVLKVNGRGLRSSVGAGNIISTYHGKGTAWQFASNPKGFSFYDGVGGEGINIGEFTNTQWCLVSMVRHHDTIMDFSINGKLLSSFIIHNNLPAVNNLKIGYNGMQHFNEDDICECLNGAITEIVMYDERGPEPLAIQSYLMNKYKIKSPPLPYYLQPWFIALLLSFIIVLVFYIMKSIQNRKMKKQLTVLKMQQKIDQERMRISQDMHDDLGSGLTKIILTSEIMKHDLDVKTSERMNQISAIAKDLVGNLSHIIWALKTENESLENLVYYIRAYSEDFFGNTTIRFIKEIQENIPSYNLTGEQHRNIFLVVKEIFNNSLKHSKASEVKLNVSIVQKQLLIIISDNGVGIEMKREKKGNGLENIKNRVERINGKCTVLSIPGSGTKFTIEINLQ